MPPMLALPTPRSTAGAGFGFDVTDAAFGTSIGALFGLGFMWRAAALWACVARADGAWLPSSVTAAAARSWRRVVGKA